MPFYSAGKIKYYQFNNLQDLGLYHAVYTRHGGFSPEPWKSLNFGASVGDDIDRVKLNRIIALNALGIDEKSVFDLYQVHSTNVVRTEKPRLPNENHIKGDAILTNRPNVTLMMRFADCVPILLFDPKKNAIGLVHAGWIGTVNKIVQKTVEQMGNTYGTKTQDIIAAVGPSIGPDHYEIRSDVVEKIEQSFNLDGSELLSTQRGKIYFDLWKANQFLMEQIGIENIEVANICTHCNLSDWYSHRGENGKTGRFGVVYGIRGL